MKVTKAIYIRRDSHQTTQKHIADSLFFWEVIPDDLMPDCWMQIKDIEIDIPDSLINDIISSNEVDDIGAKIAEHETALKELRSKQK